MSQSDGSIDQHIEHPQRLSALYQYHNAPEVAPAHGLEYDDSNYPHSDKYPVIHSIPAYNSRWTGKGFTDENRPPRIIFGMKIRTFLVVASIMIMVIVGAAVGGAVGGSTIKNTSSYTSSNSTSTNTTSTTNVLTATASPYTAPTPTFTPLNDCPAANNTLYTSSYSTGFAGAVRSDSKLNFTRYCDVDNPLQASNTLLGTFTYTFEDCIEACAGLNFYNDNGICQLAAFQTNGSRPTNCWIGSLNTTYSGLKTQAGIDIALLRL